jgi:hypothetical protein
MRAIQRVGPYIEIVEAWAPENHLSVIQVGLKESTFLRLRESGQHTRCAQFYGLIQPGLLDAVHAFRGLKRPLMRGDDMHGDANIVAYSWKPQCDFVWTGSQFQGDPIERIPPPSEVFVVLVHVLSNPEEYPDRRAIAGTIEHWSWIAQDATSLGAPAGWTERYEQHLWSR